MSSLLFRDGFMQGWPLRFVAFALGSLCFISAPSPDARAADTGAAAVAQPAASSSPATDPTGAPASPGRFVVTEDDWSILGPTKDSRACSLFSRFANDYVSGSVIINRLVDQIQIVLVQPDFTKADHDGFLQLSYDNGDPFEVEAQPMKGVFLITLKGEAATLFMDRFHKASQMTINFLSWPDEHELTLFFPTPSFKRVWDACLKPAKPAVAAPTDPAARGASPAAASSPAPAPQAP